MYYLRTDVTMLGKKQPSFGFANKKIAIAFKTKKERDQFILDTNDLSAKAISRKEAKFYVEDIFGTGKMGIYGIEYYTKNSTKDYVVFRT